MSFLKKLFGKAEPPAPRPTPPPPPEPAPIRITEILPADLKARLDNGDNVIVVDMRQSWEYHSGHIPGARHMFIQDIPAQMAELPKDRDIVLQCWHGNTSQDASAFLIQNGWEAGRVFSLRGGMAGWVNAFGPTGLEK